jgi:WD40 repeat protein
MTFQAEGHATQFNAPHGSIVVHQHGSGPNRIRRPWMAPPLAAGLVERAEITAPLLDLVCGAGAGPVAVAGVHGTGGFGKTTSVAWLCHHERVRERFPGGLLWATLGELVSGPELAARVNDLVEQLTGDRPAFADPVQAGFRLGEVLDAVADPVLLVLDDIWAEHQLEPFRYGGSQCRRMVTTRNRWVLPPATPTVRIDRMTIEQATQLLTRDTTALPPDLLDRLVAGTGRWPVLLGLVNRAIAKAVGYGQTPDGAARRILDRLASAGPHTFDLANAGQRGMAVAATVRAGLSLLQPSTVDRFGELGIFAEDTEIPIVVLELLWGPDARSVCEELADLSLVLDYRPDPGSIRLHDVLRSYLIHEAGQERLTRLHQRLITAAERLVTDGAWWDLPRPYDYLVAHLSMHLDSAGRRADLVDLVTDLRWVQTRIDRHGPEAIEFDIGRVDTNDPDGVVTPLNEAIRRSGHLFAPLEPAGSVGSVLASRLDGVPALKPLLDAYLPTLTATRLVSRWPLPDLPHPANGRTQVGHSGPISCLVIAADGAWLATGSDDTTARIFLPTRCLHVFAGHSEGVSALAAAPDGTWLATAARDGTVRIWDARSGTCLHRLTGHDGEVTVLAVAPDGAWIASAGRDGTVCVWDIHLGQRVRRLAGHTRAVTAIVVAPDGTWLATTGHDHTVRVWDASSGECRHILEGHTDRVTTAAVGADGTWLATAGCDNAIRLWEPAAGVCTHVLTAHTNRITALVVAPDDSWLASGSADATVRIWDPTTGARRHTLTGHLDEVTALANHPDAAWLASASRDGTLRIWDPIGGRRLGACTGHIGPVTAAAAAASDAATGRRRTGRMPVWLATTGTDATVRIWDPRRADAQVRAGIGHAGRVTAVMVAPDSGWIATTGDDGTVCMWNPATGDRLMTNSSHTDRVTAAASAPDGTWFATASTDGTVRIWDAATRTRRHTPTIATHAVTAMAVAPDSTWLAVTSADGSVRVWSKGTGDWRLAHDRHTDRAAAVAVSPRGEWFATASWDATVRIWDSATGECRHVLTDHTGPISTVTAGAGWFASGSADTTIRIWDVETGRCLRVLRGHIDPVDILATTADGSLLSAAGNVVRIWDPVTGAHQHTLTGHTEPVTAIATHQTSGLLATTSGDNTLRIWNPTDATAIAAIRVDSPLLRCQWLPNESAICAGGANGGLYAFDLKP